jgi:hypothetical protein
MKKYNGEEGGLLLFFVVLFELDWSRSAIAAHKRHLDDKRALVCRSDIRATTTFHDLQAQQ